MKKIVYEEVTIRRKMIELPPGVDEDEAREIFDKVAYEGVVDTDAIDEEFGLDCCIVFDGAVETFLRFDRPGCGVFEAPYLEFPEGG